MSGFGRSEVAVLRDGAPCSPFLVIGVEAAEAERGDQRKVLAEQGGGLGDPVDGLRMVEDDKVAELLGHASLPALGKERVDEIVENAFDM